MFPRRWVEKSSGAQLLGARFDPEGRSCGGDYRTTSPPLARTADDFGVAIHEYTHHLQYAMPGLDDLFVRLHRSRTDGDPILPLKYPGFVGRRDQYIDDYFGSEKPQSRPMEVITRAYEILFGRLYDKERLHDLLRDDPGMADLAIGALMRYHP